MPYLLILFSFFYCHVCLGNLDADFEKLLNKDNNSSFNELYSEWEKLSLLYSKISRETRLKFKDRYRAKVNGQFFKLQKLRLTEEVAQLKKQLSERLPRGPKKQINRGPHLKAWQKEALRQQIEEKERLLLSLRGIDLEQISNPIRCMSDLEGNEGLPSDIQRYISSASEVYTKNSGQSQSMLFTPYLSGNIPISSSNSRKLAISSAESNELSKSEILLYLQDNQARYFTADNLPEAQSSITASSSDFSSLVEEEKEMLELFGVTQWTPSSSCVDYSHLYSTPKFQKPKTAKCAGYAIASDMEAELNRGFLKQFLNEEKVSPEYAYAAILEGETDRNQPACQLIGRSVDPLLGVVSIANSLKVLGEVPVCSLNSDKAIDYPEKQKAYQVKEFKTFSFSSPPSKEALFALLDNQVTPMVTLSSEAKKESENWQYVLAEGGAYKHVVNLVGYCRGREPNCLNEVDYFIVRNSLGKKTTHFKVPAASLARMVESVDKVTKVEKLEPN